MLPPRSPRRVHRCSCQRLHTRPRFSDDIIGDDYERLQRERIAAYGEYIANLKDGEFPQPPIFIERPDEAVHAVIGEIG